MTSVEYINSSWFESKFCGRRASSPPIELKWPPIRGQRSGTPLNIHPAWIHFAHRGVATRKPASDRSSGRLFHRNSQPARPVLLLPLLRCNWPARRHRSNKHRVTFTFASFVSRVQFPFYGIFIPLDNVSTEFLKLILILRSSVAGFSHEIYSYNAYRKMEFS